MSAENEIVWSEEISDSEANDAFESSQDMSTLENKSAHCCQLVSRYEFGLNEIKDDPELYYMKSMAVLKDSNIISDPECKINEIRSAYITMYALKTFDLIPEYYHTEFIDVFFRTRHEILFNQTLLSLKMEESKSDMKFSDLFEIESDRTPDYIKVDGNSVMIIEITVTTNIQRASQSKGVEDQGFRGKYDKEIAMLSELGYTCSYHVVIFDVGDMNNQGYKSVLKNISSNLNTELDRFSMMKIELLRKEFCKITSTLYKNFGESISSLFNSGYDLKRSFVDDCEINFLKERKEFPGESFSLVSVSQPLFDNVNRLWSRLHRILDLGVDWHGDVKFIPWFDYAVSRFTFEPSLSGLNKDDWTRVLVYENKSVFCRYLKSKYKNTVVDTVRSDIEFFYYESPGSSTDLYLVSPPSEPVVFNHINSIVITNPDVHDIKFSHNYRSFSKYASEYEDLNYESKLNDMIDSLDDNYSDDETFSSFLSKIEHSFLAGKNLNREMCIKSVEMYKNEMCLKNPIGECTEIKLYHAKQPTIFPINIVYPESYSDYKTRPSYILSALDHIRIGPYTDKIIGICSNISFVWGTRPTEKEKGQLSMEANIKSLQQELMKRQKEAAVTGSMNKLPKAKDVESCREILAEISEKTKKHNRLFGKDSMGNKKIPSIRMKTSGRSIHAGDFEKEMEHFKKSGERAVYKGVGMFVGDKELESMYFSLKNFLMSPSVVSCPDDLFDTNVGEDIPLLKHFKKDYLADYSQYYEWLKSTNLYHTCAFISRFCHTLLYLSQTTLNSDYISVDNLGYSDVLLIVKGGKKIFPTKRSKLYRLIYPASKAFIDMIFPKGLISHFKRFEHMGRHYVATPWMLLHETHLTDGLTYLQKLMGFALMNLDPSRDNMSNLDKSYFNIILAIHARRQTEVCLHNLRYIMVNCLADLTALDDMLKEFAGFNYDVFQAYVRSVIAKDFEIYFDQITDIKNKCCKGNIKEVFSEGKLLHLFNKNKINTLEDFSNAVYSTYLMPKAPITQSLEQVSNFKSIMETHALFLKQSSNDIKERKVKNYKTLREDVTPLEYINGLFASDFNFDPSYMIHLGRFMADYMKNKLSKADMEIQWAKELNRNWDCMSNSSGLRGEGKDFFGRKGYFVVYDEIINGPEFESFLSKMMNGELNEKDLQKSNQTFRKRINNQELNQLIFHVVDKVQRGGKREIFVMDKSTKVHQQIIEGMMSHMCKSCPTEMISIPSNKRLHTVHTRVFETKHEEGNEQYYWVLDCRKWAPRSMLEKFIYFLSGMRGYLPDTFLMHCYNFFQLMLNKEIHTRPHIVDILTKSKSNSWVDIEWMVKSEEKNSVNFKMSYSWVMGIFNYFSSFIHVANQLHAAHLIHTTSMRNFRIFETLSPIAHSDDSAAKLSTHNKFHMRRSIFIYELLLKSANHMLSQKKSNVGRIYFEFISILYIKGELLPLLPKFLGSFNFHPTDAGYCNDVLDAYSRCIEIIQNGGTFQQAYMSMKIQSMLIWRFYFGLNRKMIYNLPPQMFGAPDAHPICVLFSGSDSDTLRLISLPNGPQKLNRLNYIYESLAINDETDFTIYKPITATPDVKPGKIVSKHLTALPPSMELSWTLKNVNFSHSLIGAVQYIIKLKDPRFVASLQDDNLTRRVSRSFYFRDHDVLNTRMGKMSQGNLMRLIISAENCGDEDFFKILNFEGSEEVKEKILKGINSKYRNMDLLRLMHSELMGLMEYWKNIDYDEANITVHKKTTKPIHISLQKIIGSITTKFEPSVLTSWIKEPEYRNILPNTIGCLSAEVEINQVLDDFGVKMDEVPTQALYHVLSKFKSKTFSNIYCYGNVPSGLREINTYQDVTLLLAHNSFPSKFINGLTLPLGRMVNVSSQQILPELKMEDVQITCSMMNIMVAAFHTLEGESWTDFLKLDIVKPHFLETNLETIKMGELPKAFHDHWKTKRAIVSYFGCLIKIVSNLVDEKIIDFLVLKDSYYHSYVKRQSLIMDKWVGIGHFYVSVGEIRMMLFVKGKVVDKIMFQTSNISLNKIQINYINYVLNNSECMQLNECMITIGSEMFDELCFGINIDGEYTIDLGRNLKYMIPILIIEPTLKCKLTSPEMLEMKLLPRMKIEAVSRDEIYGRQKFIINVLSIDTEKSVHVARKLLAHTKNNELITSFWNSDLNSYIIDVISEGMELGMYVDVKPVITHYEYSKIFEIMQVCEKMSLVSLKNIRVREKTFPAQEGGVLDMLIKYQTRFPDFPFKWDRIVTPELMSIKSSQPEAFVSSLVDKVKERFDALYYVDEKSQIMGELYKIMESIDQEGKSSELMSMLSNWGYTGVAGAIDSMSTGSNFKVLEVFREYNSDFGFLAEFANIFVKFLKACISTVIEEMETFIACYENLFCKNINRFTPSTLKVYIVSILHIITTSTYTKNPGLTPAYISIPDMFFVECMSAFLSNDILIVRFRNNLKGHYLLESIPIENGSINELVLIYRSLYHCYKNHGMENNYIDANIKNPQATNYILPSVKTKGLCSEMGIEFSFRRAYFSGLCSDKFLTRLSTSYNLTYGNENYSLWFKIQSHKGIGRVKYHPEYFFKKMVTEDFLDSDQFMDINLEFSSSEMDKESVEDSIKSFIEDEGMDPWDDSGVYYRIIRGKKVKQVKVTVLNFLGYGNPQEYTQFIRQSGNDVVVLCNSIYIPMLWPEQPFMFFQFNDPDWYNHSLCKHDHIFAIVLSNNVRKPQIWEQALNANYLDKASIHKAINMFGMTEIRSSSGSIYNIISLLYGDISNRLWEEEIGFAKEDIMEEAESSEQPENFELNDEDIFQEKLTSLGFDEDSINKFMNVFKKAGESKNKKHTDIFMEAIANMFKKKSMLEALKAMNESLLKAPMTEEQITRIFQVPYYFGSQITKDSTIKNNALKDQKLIAEINCLTGDMCSKIISGNLTITPKTHRLISTTINMCNKLIKVTNTNKKQKRFLVDFYTLVVNDAHIATDSDSNEEWYDLMSILNEYVSFDEEDVNDDFDIYSPEIDKGRLPYHLMGDHTRFSA